MCSNWTQKEGEEMAKFDLKSLLSEKSLAKEESKEGVVKSKAFKVTSLSVYDLVPSEHNFYRTDDIKELKEAIELFGGIKQNLIVKKLEGGKYTVIAGHKRRLASLALVEEGKAQFEYVPCVVEEDTGSIEERLMLIMTNSTARQLTDYEKMCQAEELKELLTAYKKQEKIPGRIRDLVAEILNTSSAQVGRMEAITNNLSDEFVEEFKESKVNLSTAYELSGLPEEKQEVAYQKYKENGSITMNEVKAMKKDNQKAEQEEIEKPLEGQVAFYEIENKHDIVEEQTKGAEVKNIEEQEVKCKEKQDDNKVIEGKGCGFCKEDYHTSIMTEEGSYLIDIDSKNKIVKVLKRECEIETIAFVFCPMCGRKI